MNNREISLLIILGLIGLTVWVVIGKISQGAEAWDSTYYYTLGLPLMCISSAIAGYIAPRKPVFFGIAAVILQPIALLFQGEIGPLLIVGMLFFLFFAAFTVGSAFLGAALRKRKISKLKG